MKVKLFEHTKLASYFLWDYTRYDNALKLWYCAQDLARYMERVGITSYAHIEEIRNKGIYNDEYIGFVRHIAFRIYVYSDSRDDIANWYNAEKLLANYEWCSALVSIAAIFRDKKENGE